MPAAPTRLAVLHDAGCAALRAAAEEPAAGGRPFLFPIERILHCGSSGCVALVRLPSCTDKGCGACAVAGGTCKRLAACKRIDATTAEGLQQARPPASGSLRRGCAPSSADARAIDTSERGGGCVSTGGATRQARRDPPLSSRHPPCPPRA